MASGLFPCAARGTLRDLRLALARCCGGLFATTSTARSKRCQASGANSTSFNFFGSDFAMTKASTVITLPTSRDGQPPRDAFRYDDWDMPWAFQAIGRLVHGYVNLEQHLTSFFGELTGVPWPMSTLLQGDGRPSTYMGTIKRLARARGFDEKVFRHTEMIFEEINYVKEIRDVCAHCSITYIAKDQPWMLFHNVFTAPIDKRRQHIISHDDLIAYAFYMFELARHLGALTGGKLPEPPTLQGRPALLEILHPRSHGHPNAPKNPCPPRPSRGSRRKAAMDQRKK